MWFQTKYTNKYGMGVRSSIWRFIRILREVHDMPFKYVPFDLASQKDLQYRIGTPLAEKPSHHRSPLVGN